MAAPARSLFDVIEQRSSVRAYRTQKLDRDSVDRLLAAAVRAPTAMHAESWRFVVVQDDDLLRRISDQAKELFNWGTHHARLHLRGDALNVFASKDFNVFYNAGTLIVICTDLTWEFAAADCWLAAENLMLAACANGLGTCVIGSALAAINSPAMKKELEISAEMTAIAPIIVGYPAGAVKPSERKAPQILAWL